MEYEFTQDWFSWNQPTWLELFKQLDSKKSFLEIGCFEGRATCWLAENVLEDGGSITSIDTFNGGFEHSAETMAGVKARFLNNVEVTKSKRPSVNVTLCEGLSVAEMAKMITAGQSYDFVYVDGSHSGPDVLSDAILAYNLCRIGGLIAFDDYLWGNFHDLIERPKVAVDCFINLFSKKVRMVHIGYQVWVQKIS